MSEQFNTLSAKPEKAFPLCYHQGRFVEWADATLHASSLAMRYALSVFEGIRLYRQHDASDMRAFELSAHLRRLEDSLRLMRLPDAGSQQLPSILDELVKRNRIEEDCYVRVSVSAHNFGEMSAQTQTTLTVTVTRMGRKKWLAEGRRMKVAVSAWQRTPEMSFPAAAKNISNYAGPRLALLQAKDDGYDNTILTTSDGFLCEGPTSSLFIIRDGEALTPPLSDGILPSITRRVILELCHKLDIPAREARLTRTDTYMCDEAFLCGTGLEIGPIESFDNRPLRGAEQAHITMRLIDAFFHLVRGVPSQTAEGRTQASRQL